MATMNPLDYYRDPALDDLVEHSPRILRNGQPQRDGSHPRRAVSDSYRDYPEGHPPPVPEVPQGPPISYRVPGGASDGTVQRSFSQRARGRPYAEEAFANHEVPDPNNGVSRRQVSATKKPVQNSSIPLHNEPAPNKARRQRLIQENIRSAAEEAVASPHERRVRSQGGPVSRNLETDPTAGMPRSTAVSDAMDQTEDSARDWAPDRSPLQKLEVTLNDISKEEKRARVQEAEMLLQEKSRSQKASSREAANVSSRRSVPRSEKKQVKEAPRLEDAGIVRNLSSTHRDRLQHSTTIDSRKPDPKRLSGERRGFEYEKNQPPQVATAPVTRTSRSSGDADHRNSSSAPLRATSNPQARPERASRTVAEPTRSISASHRDVVDRPREDASTFINRPLQPRVREEDRLPTAQERNASHRAALAQLTGADAAAVASRGDSRRLQKKRPESFQPQQVSTTGGLAREAVPVNERNNVVMPPTSGPSMARPNVGTSDLRTPPPAAALAAGLQQSPGIRSIDSPIPNETPKQKQRRSSVSFKEPFDRRRPVDEWKEAETARLMLGDFRQTERVTEGDHDKAWWEEDAKARRRKSQQAQTTTPSGNFAIDDRIAEFRPQLYLKCGPLLRYTGLKRTSEGSGAGGQEFWRGTVMIVTQDSQSSYGERPTLRLFVQPKQLLPPPPALVGDEELAPEYVDPIAGLTKLSRTGRALYIRPIEDLEEGKDLSQVETDEGLFETSPRPVDGANDNVISMATINNRTASDDGERLGQFKEVKGVRLYGDPERDVTFWLFKLEIELGSEQQHIAYRINRGAATGFWVPAKGQTMNIMFHSCNGFSASVNSHEFSGPDPLWRDILNTHQTRPFHVMIGGGDQIYNDKVSTETHLFGSWTQNKNPHWKHHAPFISEMKQELESFYLQRYCMWFSQGLFGLANSQIPMVNIWDDHDIIDGFGSYPEPFMQSPVFSGVGNVAFKYYMLFQHHSVEAMTAADEPSWLLGYKPGPYIKQLSRSVFLELGRSVAFLGLDCRTERRRDEVINVDTCDLALERCRKEIIEGQTKHLLVLLGVPIAYPRLNWLENVLTSRAMDPIKAMGRYGMIKGGFLNKFDGGVEILDDLDDHWTASHHKSERNWFIKELQDLAAERSVRITILGGDVHLAAIGQFYSNPKLRVPKDLDHRYMPNIISSAIVNTPPPEMMADIINKRNKVHHLNEYTDESMIPMFTHDVDMKKRNNKHLLPRRNWCSISEYAPGKTPPSSRSTSPSMSESIISENEQDISIPKRRFSITRDDVNPRTLFRRLSSRNAPPTSYRDTMEPPLTKPMRSASYDGTTGAAGDRTLWNRAMGSGQRAASETRDTPDRRDSVDPTRPRARPPLRPGFHRRPTNLSKKAVKKGNVPAIDAEGNEFDVNDHVNLEGGLDIVLNCEVNPKNPAGITTPYRLLIPALWYDGTSDIEKLPADGIQRRPTLLQKFGLGGRQGHKAARSQGAGNWGKDSETESFTESEEGNESQQPRRKFGFLGSLRRRPDRDDFSDEEAVDDGRKGNIPPQSGITRDPAPQMSHRTAPVASDMLHDTTNRSSQGANAGFNKPPTRTEQNRGLNQTAFDFSTSSPNAHGPRRSFDAQQSEPTALPQPQATYDPLSPTQPISRHGSRPKSYIIGSRSGSANHPTSGVDQTSSRASGIYDEDSAYVRRQQQGNAQQNPPSSYPTQTYPDSAQQPPRRSLSKQEQVLGIATDRDSFSNNPQQRQLRGNGIIGKNFSPTSPSSYQRDSYVPSSQHPTHQQTSQLSRGYSGIEAYKEKPTRRWSLREKARNLMDKVEGRKKYDDNSYSGSDSYSDEEEDDIGKQKVQARGPQQQSAPPLSFERGPGRMPSQNQGQQYRQSSGGPPPPQNRHVY